MIGLILYAFCALSGAQATQLNVEKVVHELLGRVAELSQQVTALKEVHLHQAQTLAEYQVLLMTYDLRLMTYDL